MENRLKLFCLMLSFSFTNVSDGAVAEKDLTARIDEYLQQSLQNGYSCSVLLAKDNQILFKKGYGFANREKSLLIVPSTTFNIGSITKQFTATAIQKLAESGRLKTSDALHHFFPNVPEDKKDITIHQLLTHTSGVSPSTGGFRYDSTSLAKFLDIFFKSELKYVSEYKHQYANANYILLAAIIEKVSRQSYESYLAEHFWDPLGMVNTGYRANPPQKTRVAQGYYYNLDEGIWKNWGTTNEHLPEKDEHWFSIGKGDIYSTTEDLFRWHQALMSRTILASTSVNQMETPFVAENDSNRSFYGYGWAIFNSDRNTKIVTHNGSNGIYFADFVRFVEEDVVVIALSNVRLGRDAESVAWQIASMLFDKTYQPKPVARLSYEIVYDFTKQMELDYVCELIPLLEKEMGQPLRDKRLFNTLGFRILKKEPTPAWGLELLKLNTEQFPDDGNLWDSLGEAYYIYKQKPQALHCFEQAIKLSKNTEDHWLEHSMKRSKELKNELGHEFSETSIDSETQVSTGRR